MGSTKNDLLCIENNYVSFSSKCSCSKYPGYNFNNFSIFNTEKRQDWGGGVYLYWPLTCLISSCIRKWAWLWALYVIGDIGLVGQVTGLNCYRYLAVLQVAGPRCFHD